MAAAALVPDNDKRQALYGHLVLLHDFVQKAADEATRGEARLAAAQEQLATIAEDQLILRQHLDTAAASVSVIGDIIGLNPAAELGTGPFESAFAHSAEHEDQEPKPSYDSYFTPGLGRDPHVEWEFPPLEITTQECTDFARGAIPGWFVQPHPLLTQRALPGETTGVGSLPCIPSGSAAGAATSVLDQGDADEDEAQLDVPSVRPSRRPWSTRTRCTRLPETIVDQGPSPKPSTAKRFRSGDDRGPLPGSQSSQGSDDRGRRTQDALALGQASAILKTIAATLGTTPDESRPGR